MLSRFIHVRLCDPMDCSPPGSSVDGVLQARILQWIARPSSRRSSQPRDLKAPALAGGFFTTSTTWEAPRRWVKRKKKNYPSRHDLWNLPGSPVVKSSPSNTGSEISVPHQGPKIPHASGPKNQNIKQKQHCTKFNEDLKKKKKGMIFSQIC